MQDSPDSTEALKEQTRRLAEENRQLQATLFELQAANPVKSRQAVLEEIARAGVDVLRAEAAGVYLIDFETEELVFEAVIGGGGPALQSYRMPLGQGIPGLVAATGQAHIIANAEEDGRIAKSVVEVTGYQPKSVLCVPLFFDGKVIGVLGFYDKRSDDGFIQADISVATAFASIAAQVLGQSLRLVQTGDSLGGTRQLGDSAKLVSLVRDLAFKGDDEMRLCTQILEAFTVFLESGSRIER